MSNLLFYHKWAASVTLPVMYGALCTRWCDSEIFAEIYIHQIAPMYHRSLATFDLVVDPTSELTLEFWSYANSSSNLMRLMKKSPPPLILRVDLTSELEPEFRSYSNLSSKFQSMRPTTSKLEPEFRSNVTDEGQPKGALLQCITTN